VGGGGEEQKKQTWHTIGYIRRFGYDIIIMNAPFSQYFVG
jgi:hypothetical protein